MGRILNEITKQLSSDRFKALPPEKQKAVREKFAQDLLPQDPDYATRMDEAQRTRVKTVILTGFRVSEGRKSSLIPTTTEELKEDVRDVGKIFFRRSQSVLSEAQKRGQEAISAAKKGEVGTAVGKSLLGSLALTGAPLAPTVGAPVESAARGLGFKPGQAGLTGTLAEAVAPFGGSKLRASQKAVEAARSLPPVARATEATIEAFARSKKLRQGLTTPFTPLERGIGPRGAKALREMGLPLPKGLSATRTLRRLPKGLEDVRMDPEKLRKILDVGEKAIRDSGRAPSRETFTLDVLDAILDNPNGVFNTFLKAGVTRGDLAAVVSGSITNAAKDLSKLSAMSRRLRSLRNVEGGDQLLEEVTQKSFKDLTLGQRAFFYAKRVSDLWRASLVTQMKTAMRNLEVQGVRVPLQALTNAIDDAISTTVGIAKGSHKAADFLGGLDETLEFFKRVGGRGQSKKLFAMLDEAPAAKESLFLRYTSDVSKLTPEGGGGAFDKFTRAHGKVIETFNVLNITQEFGIRSMYFPMAMARRLRKAGVIKRLSDIDNLDFSKVDEKLIFDAVDDTLDVTFARSPKGMVGKGFVRLFSLPGLAQGIPFPRFLTNAIRFNFEFSPAGALKLLSKAEREKIAAGDMSTLAKTLVGTNLATAGYMLRESEWAGPKWYQLQDPETGKIYDTRPFFPLAPYLLWGELTRVAQGKADPISGSDFLEGAIGMSFRFGASAFKLEQLDSLLETIGQPKSAAEAEAILKQLVSNIPAGFATPMGTSKDFFSDPKFVEYASKIQQAVGRPTDVEANVKEAMEEAIIREKRLSPLFSPALERFPGLSQGLPEKKFPTGLSPARREETSVAQATGLLARTRTKAQKILDDHKFTNQDILPTSGIVALDAKIAEEMRPLIEEAIPKLAGRSAFKATRDKRKRRILIDEVIKRIRSSARAKVLQKNPALNIEKKLRSEKQDIEELMRERAKERGIELPFETAP